MMNLRFSDGRGGARLSLPLLLLALFPLFSWAAGGGGPSSTDTDPTSNASAPGEEVTSLPVVEDSSGLTFLGGLRELRALDISLRGRGRVVVQRVGAHLLAVTLVGDYQVQLDRAALAVSNVAVLFKGGVAYQGGTAVLQIGSSAPTLVGAERVPLPVARLAASPRAQGDLLTLDAFGRMARSHIEANFAATRVTLTQRAF